MILYKFLDALTALFAVQIVRAYLTSFQKGPFRHKSACLASWILYLLLQYFIITSDAEHPLPILVANILLMTLIQFFSGSSDFRTALFRSGVLGASWMAIEVIVQILLLSIGTDGAYFFTAGNLISKIVMYLTVHVYRRWQGQNNSIPLPFWHWIELFIIPASSILIIYHAYLSSLQSGIYTFFFLVSALVILINFIIFDLYEKMGAHALVERQKQACEQEISLCVKQAAEREEAYRQTRILRHDLKDHLIALNSFLKEGRVSEAEIEIEKMLEGNSLNGHGIAETGNLALDALVNYKNSSAASRGIRMKGLLDVPSDLFVKSADLCVILGNLLDNALEATEKIPLDKDRWINLTVRLNKGVLLIAVENPYIGTITVDNQGKIHSHKTGDHGIGLLSVERTISKYNGKMSFHYENETFHVSAALFQSEFLHETP